MNQELQVLLVEDNPDDRKLISVILNKAFEAVSIKEVFSMAEVKAALHSNIYNIVLTDYHMSGFTGFDVVNEVRANQLDIPVILITADKTANTAVEALKLQVDDYVIKDFKYINRLPSIIRRVLKNAPIEQLKRDTKESLSDTLNNYKDIFETSAELVQSVWMDGSFLNVNKSWCDSLGYSRNEVSSLNISDIVDETSKTDFDSLIQRARAQEGRHQQVNLTFKTKSGKLIYLEGSVNTRMLESKPIATHWILRDVTNSKMVEKLLWDINDQYMSAFEYAPEPMILGDQRGIILQINRAACELVGYSYEEMTGLQINKITHPEDLARSQQFHRKMFSGEIDSYNYEKRYMHKSGKYVPVKISGTLIRNSNGQPRYVVVQLKEVKAESDAELSA